VILSQEPRTNQTRQQSWSWTFLGLYIAWAFLLKSVAAHVLPPSALGLTEQLLLTCFFVAHALVYYSSREVFFYALTSALISNLFENLSVLYGFPFGYYVHTDLAGPKLFNVPYVVTLIYMAIGYVSWMVAQVILRRTRYKDWDRMAFIAPLIAAFVFTVWDFCVDPVYGTIYKAFIYRNPGPWFGVPVGNYFGWLFMTYLVYAAFALFLRKRGHRHVGRGEPGRIYWLQTILAYLVIAVSAIVTDLRGPVMNITVADGRVWNTGDIYPALALATLFTMLFITLLALVILYGEGRDFAAS